MTFELFGNTILVANIKLGLFLGHPLSRRDYKKSDPKVESWSPLGPAPHFPGSSQDGDGSIPGTCWLARLGLQASHIQTLWWASGRPPNRKKDVSFGRAEMETSTKPPFGASFPAPAVFEVQDGAELGHLCCLLEGDLRAQGVLELQLVCQGIGCLV